MTLCSATALAALQEQPFFKQSFLNLADDLAEAKGSGKFLMLVYEQEGCPYCAKMHQSILSDADVIRSLEKHFDIVQLDIWGGRELVDFAGKNTSERKFARDLGLHFSPMIVVYDGNGKEVYRMAGFYGLPHFRLVLEYLANGAYRKMPFHEYQRGQMREIATARSQASQGHKMFLKSGSLKEASALAAKAGKGIALLIDASSRCADCVEMHEKNLTDPVTARLLESNFVAVHANLDLSAPVEHYDRRKLSPATLARELNVRYIPTMVFMDAKGKEILRHESYLEPKHFQLLLQYVTSKERVRFASFQDWIRARNTGQIEKKAP
jgi:thioredoxin-related protein